MHDASQRLALAAQTAPAPKSGPNDGKPSPDKPIDTSAKKRRPMRFALIGVVPLSILFLVLMIVPLVLVVDLSFSNFDYALGVQPGYTLEHFALVIQDSFFLEIFWRTLWISALTTLICVAIGLPQAYILSRMSVRWRSVFLLIVLSPLLVSTVVRAFGWSMLLGPSGPIGIAASNLGLGPLLYTPTAVVIGLVHVMLPFMIIPVWTSLQKLDPAVEYAAYSLSASRTQTLWRVILPQAVPGILSGSLIVFGLTASAFATPALLGGRRLKVVSTLVYDEILSELNWPLGATIAIFLLLANVAIMLSYNRVVERSYKRSLG